MPKTNPAGTIMHRISARHNFADVQKAEHTKIKNTNPPILRTQFPCLYTKLT